MTAALANGTPLTGLRILVPRRGPMMVEASSQTVPAPSAGQYLFQLGDLAALCSAVRVGTFANSWSVLAVGGRGGWRKALPAKGYRSSFGLLDAQIYLDAAAAAGELPPIVATPRMVGGFYTRRAGAASNVFELLGPGTDWWVNSAGVTMVGTRLPLPALTPFDLLEYDPNKGRLVIATDSPASFVPGTIFTDPLAGAFTVNSAVWTATENGTRGEIWTA